ncbi:hypothetical protein CISG_09035 [Coccidioides immitis RMSCC 3703]|uniref:Uncharacterized protein n=1 Tax=Coccidioides immitis RMSCC 3703 TaxID=454286 RepID=A0A0J8R8V3_COCIT|nr:hypothetical protein CISG_09035 [Coccidioides immitis RMSCC 3703]
MRLAQAPELAHSKITQSTAAPLKVRQWASPDPSVNKQQERAWICKSLENYPSMEDGEFTSWKAVHFRQNRARDGKEDPPAPQAAGPGAVAPAPESNRVTPISTLWLLEQAKDIETEHLFRQGRVNSPDLSHLRNVRHKDGSPS